MTQTFEFDPNAFLPEMQAEADKTLLVKFEYRPRQDAAATLKEGRPVFKETLYIDIRAPGDRLGGICRPANQNDINRFPLHYKAFLARTGDEKETLVGTPLAEWPQVTRSQVEELAFVHIKTVEQLAEVADVHAARIMGIQTLREKAKAWLRVAKDNAATMKMAEELEQRDLRIEQLEQQVTELAKKLEEQPAVVETVVQQGNTDELAELKRMVQQLAADREADKAAAVQPKRKPGRPKVKKPEPEQE